MSGRLPVIGMTCFNDSWVFDCGTWPIKAVEAEYVRAVADAGGLPVMLAGRPTQAMALLERIDGLLMTGGVDVNPVHYGEARDPRTGPPDVERDAYEIALVRGAIAAGIPVLGICRGIQLINVALGGTLHQHVEHAVKDKPTIPVHDVEVLEASRLFGVVGRHRLQVNSLHHQCVKEVAPSLRTSASAPDGVVEAVEGLDSPVLAVQWHPEMQQVGTSAPELFTWLVEESSNYLQHRWPPAAPA